MKDTMKDNKICVVGLGGVGGYIGGILAREYPHVVFFARGARKESNRFLYKLADDTTSSLCRDMAAGKPNELETFSGYLLELGKQYGLELPYTDRFYKELKTRSL